MMRDRPGGAELLSLARRLLREDLVTLLPPERRYDALMAANAMAIAARELELGEAPAREELRGLASFCGEPVPAAADLAAVEAEVIRLSGRLAADIRAGRTGEVAEERDVLWQLLLEGVKRKLRESNPRALAAAGFR